MTKKFGNNYRLYVGDGGGSEAFSALAGQRDLSVSGSSGEIDISDKTNAPYKLTAPGLFTRTITVSGVADLPDTTGFTRLETQFKAQATVNIELRKTPFGGTDGVVEGSFYVTAFEVSAGMNNELTYSITLNPSAALTTDVWS